MQLVAPSGRGERPAGRPPPEQKGLVGSRDLSLDSVEPISSIRGAQKLTATASQTPCSPGHLGPQSWEERITGSLQVPLMEGKAAELWGVEGGGPVPALTLRLLSRLHSPGRSPSKQPPFATGTRFPLARGWAGEPPPLRKQNLLF